ncbi:hypothetical protein [Hyunsoonleella pacifica]|uniref:Uncharacterized protein n=1 Tax=Hyunsoonleella pacifica TaxID=1080224 RepID=A0A4Q9FMG1_9FLAO|nr:hypothetical protein [Hyunsoonleella pacifica]TBN15390.1 hypothetical protein EYD46_09620 [Hyunsoonleella pacifica]GGD23661.1 hypothetical protein GCM10011368_27160 [Hyunsoonleella pacifica]
MVLNNIENLLEKYENGETSLKEEQVLKNYFSEDNVAPHLEHYKPMFVYFLGNQQEQFTKDLPLKTKKVFNYKWVSVAAVAVIMLGVYFTNPFGGSQKCEPNLVGTFCEPEEAFNEVSKQLAMISNHFNKGTSTVNYLDEVNKGASTLNYLNEIENSTSIIFKTN